MITVRYCFLNSLRRRAVVPVRYATHQHLLREILSSVTYVRMLFILTSPLILSLHQWPYIQVSPPNPIRSTVSFADEPLTSDEA